jgi:hypothetical protein
VVAQYEWIGFLVVAALGWLVVAVAVSTRLSPGVKRLLIIGLALRIVGSLTRYEMIFRLYGGLGDSVSYFNAGLQYAELIRNLDFSFLFESAGWWAGRWWGTQFQRWITGFVVALIGPSMRGGYLFYSFISFGALCLFGLAFHRAYPYLPTSRYLIWLFLWPSLWFWPSSIGKDSVMLLAVGLVTAGYVGRRNTMGWPLLVAGLALATAIRPHVAGVTVVGVAAAHWLGMFRRMTAWSLAQAVGILLVAIFVLNTALGQLGLDDVDLEGVQEFMETHAVLSSQGGSSIDTPGGGWLQVPMAYVNILLRPFPWEAHNPQALVAALEIVVFWVVVYRRRRRILGVLRHWRKDRFLRLALPLTLLYVAMIGLVFGNLGIIARQRVVILPFLFLFLEAIPRSYAEQILERARSRAGSRRPTPQRPAVAATSALRRAP